MQRLNFFDISSVRKIGNLTIKNCASLKKNLEALFVNGIFNDFFSAGLR